VSHFKSEFYTTGTRGPEFSDADINYVFMTLIAWKVVILSFLDKSYLNLDAFIKDYKMLPSRVNFKILKTKRK